MRPVIGLILDEELLPAQDGSTFSRRPFYALRMGYFDAIAKAGGAPIAIPYRLDAFEDYLNICDGWLAPGGDYRFAPDWYAAPPPQALVKPSLRRDFEIEAVSRILDADAPLLGVCNGMQVMAGVTGGRIAYHGHVTRPGGDVLHGDPAGALMHHAVTLSSGSPLATIYGALTLTTNSAHREDVALVGGGARIIARAQDGVIEAIDLPNKRFAIGVQWHPELEDSDPLFAALVDAARS